MLDWYAAHTLELCLMAGIAAVMLLTSKGLRKDRVIAEITGTPSGIFYPVAVLAEVAGIWSLTISLAWT